VTKYYCQVEHEGRQFRGMREALTPDLALACFLQDMGLDEDSDAAALVDTKPEE